MTVSFYAVCAQMAVGGFASLLFAPPLQIGRGFYRLAAAIYAAAVGALIWLGPQMPFGSFSAAGKIFSALVFLGAVLAWTRWARLMPILAWASIPAGAFFLAALAFRVHAAFPPVMSAPTLAVRFGLSAGLVGFSMTAMLFGHWYLTTPEMPTRYLMRLQRCLLSAWAGTAAWILYSLWGRWEYASLTAPGGVFILARILFGAAAVGVCAWLAWFFLREDSTQSATGFLYLASVFAVMGEFLAYDLTLRAGLPI